MESVQIKGVDSTERVTKGPYFYWEDASIEK